MIGEGRGPKSHFSEDESDKLAGWGLTVIGRKGLGFGLCSDSRLESKR